MNETIIFRQGRSGMLHYSRRFIQAVILLLIVAMPLVSFYARLLSGKGQRELSDVAMSEEGRFFGSIYVMMDKVYDPHINKVTEAVEKLDGFKGGIWSLTIFGFNMTDPLAGIAAMIGSKGFYMPLLISMAVPVLFMLLFGRAFCGWICPMNTLFEINNWFRNLMEKFLFRPVDIQLDRSYKYSVLIISLILTAAGISLLPYLLPYAVVTRQPYYYVFYRTFGIGMTIIFLMFALELFISRRGWCRSLCPGGAFFSLFGRYRLVRVKRDPSGCMTNCDLCTQACKMGLAPHNDDTGMECDNCGLCVSSCPSNAMKYTVSPTDPKSTTKRLMVIWMFFYILSLPSEAHAAHAKLINPHAQEGEHTGEHTYPMAPSEEHSIRVGDYLVSFSAFQFREMEQRGIKVKSVTTVKEKTGRPYNGPLSMDIIEMGLFGTVQQSSHYFEKPFENQYKRFDWFHNDARCRVRIVFTVDGKKIEAEFPLKVGDPLPSGIFLGSLGLLLGSVIGVVVFINRKRSKERFIPAG